MSHLIDNLNILMCPKCTGDLKITDSLECLKLFHSTGFYFINSIPKIKLFEKLSEKERLFKKNPRGSWLDRFMIQTAMVFKGSKEGGLFLMIGKKRIEP